MENFDRGFMWAVLTLIVVFAFGTIVFADWAYRRRMSVAATISHVGTSLVHLADKTQENIADHRRGLNTPESSAAYFDIPLVYAPGDEPPRHLQKHIVKFVIKNGMILTTRGSVPAHTQGLVLIDFTTLSDLVRSGKDGNDA